MPAPRTPRTLFSKLAHGGLAAAALILLTAAAEVPESGLSPRAELDIPQIGEPADLSLSPREELEIGASVVAGLYREGVVLDDAELTEYISTIGWRLAEHAENKPEQLSFFMVRDPRINAFALPGGYIGFNAGLLTAASSESELAGVMGHELAHVTQRHIARTIEGSKNSAIATWAAVLAAILLGSASPDVVLAAISLGQGLAYQTQVNYTRAHEMEADRFGIDTMFQAGFDPDGMASFFQRLEQQSRLYGAGLPEILRTHPVNTTRVAEARSRAAELGEHRTQDSAEFPLMQARATVLASRRPSEALELFMGRMAAGADTPALRYGAALASLELGQAQRAAELLAPALRQQPRQPNLMLLEARIQQASGASDAAFASARRVLEAYPRLPPAIFTYADLLIMADRAADARQFLLDHEVALGDRAELHRLLASAARETSNNAELAYHSASYYFRRGDAPGALAQLDAGLRMAALSAQERAKLVAFRTEVRETLPRNWRPQPEPRR